MPPSGPLRWILPVALAAISACAQTQSPAASGRADEVGADSSNKTAASKPPAWDPGASLSPEAKAELAEVLRDEFCPCGCPHTIAACLSTHTCEHAKRSASLAARMVGAGLPASEAALALAQYYRGFRAPRAAFEVDPRQCQGSADAPVTLVTFSDFECPYCAATRPVIEAFARANAGSLRFCSLLFPLPLHPHALIAGQAALFAREHGRYWEMHDRIFAAQADLSEQTLKDLARSIGLDSRALSNALSNETFLPQLEAQRDMGRAAGVAGTPAVFFNGRRYLLPLSDANLAQALEEELEWAANGGAWAQDG